MESELVAALAIKGFVDNNRAGVLSVPTNSSL
jgi:hypothetical protein